MKTVEELQAEYRGLAHAIQSGVALKMNHDRSETEPKHLRVGVNMAMIEHGALLKVLFKKGIITEQEYWESEVEMAQKEVEMYEEYFRGRGITGVHLA